MVAFPYDTLITAVSTLTAALGGVGLKDRSDRKERRDEARQREKDARIGQRRDAYADLVTTARTEGLPFSLVFAPHQPGTEVSGRPGGCAVH